MKLQTSALIFSCARPHEILSAVFYRHHPGVEALLREDAYKELILSSLHFLVKNNRIAVYGFVLMPNHIHLIWHIAEGHKREEVQRDFLKYTAQQIMWDLKTRNPSLPEQFRVDPKDRRYQIWERNPLTVDIFTEKVLLQKLHYIHHNPLQEKWRLCILPEEYPSSTVCFYHSGVDTHGFLTHYLG
jgi:putative transposase